MSLRNGIFRAHQRGESICLNRQIGEGRSRDVTSASHARLIETHHAVKKGWGQLSQKLVVEGATYASRKMSSDSSSARGRCTRTRNSRCANCE